MKDMKQSWQISRMMKKIVDGHRGFIILSLYFCKCLKIFHCKVQKKSSKQVKLKRLGGRRQCLYSAVDSRGAELGHLPGFSHL